MRGAAQGAPAPPPPTGPGTELVTCPASHPPARPGSREGWALPAHDSLPHVLVASLQVGGGGSEEVRSSLNRGARLKPHFSTPVPWPSRRAWLGDPSGAPIPAHSLTGRENEAQGGQALEQRSAGWGAAHGVLQWHLSGDKGINGWQDRDDDPPLPRRPSLHLSLLFLPSLCTSGL